MKLRYILLGFFLLLACIAGYSQGETGSPCEGCSAYLMDSDNDGYGEAGIHWFIPGNQHQGYILASNSHGIDCNDEDPNQTLLRFWYVDSDNDTFGGDTRTPTKMCERPEAWYVDNSDDCDDNDGLINPNTPWYSDTDGDGIGSSSNIIHSCIKPQNFVSTAGDACPTVNGGNNPSGCPTVNNPSLSDENYVYTRIFKKPVQDLSQSIPAKDQVESITYFDGLGRPMQKIDIGTGGQGQDIIEPMGYDNNGLSPKLYLPFANVTSQNGQIIANAIGNQNAFYNVSKYDFTLNPFEETRTEKSGLGRVIEIGEPGNDWQLLVNSDTDHTVKYQHQTNIIKEVRAFDVVFSANTTEDHNLKADGFYGTNKLYKKIIKNENWTAGFNNTVQEFQNNEGHTVLRREFSNNEAFNTYYVYDIYDNVSYVIPPLANDAIDAYFQTTATSNRNYPWTSIAQVDGNLAVEYNKLFEQYNNEFIASTDLFNKYGGQGGFTLSTNANNELVLSINITTLQPLDLKTGEILSLKDIGNFKDTELSRISGNGYDYIFSIKNNYLVINGKGKISAINSSTIANTKFIYNKNYPWSSLVDIPSGDFERIQLLYSQIDNSLILTANVENPYGAKGGVNITIDENDAVAMTLNITATSLLKFKKGIVFPLNIERRLPNSDLGTISEAGYKYHFYVKENSLFIDGDGSFTNVNRTPVGGGPGSVSLTIPIDIIEGLCYEYHYDSRNRLVEKKIPGKGWEYIVYDKLNRPVITQDALMRSNGMWLFAKYDALNRIIYNGQFGYASPTGNTDSLLRKEIQALIDANATVYESFSATPFSNGGIDINYTSLNFPDAWLPDVSDFTILSVKYFDNYNFKPYGTTVSIPTSSYNSTSNNILDNVKSMETGSLIRVLTHQDNWIFNTVAYDDKSRMVWTKSQNSYLNTEDVVDIELDFLGKTLESKTTHNKTGVTVNFETIDTYTYDGVGRLLKHIQKAGSNSDELITYNKYDDLGKLINNKVGGPAPAPSIDFDNFTAFLQNINYTYNVRGWLKSINDPNATLTDNLFAFGINYNEIRPGVTSLFNGNISQTSWKSKTDNQIRKYNYGYDTLDRLIDANYIGNYPLLANASATENYSENAIRYDKNGNIAHLERYGLKSNNTSIDLIDKLDYDYNSRSNTLAKVNDFSMESAGFKDNAIGSNDYGYDINGNVTADGNKGITQIKYNYLNLPEKFVFNYEDPDTSVHPNAIIFIYDALGNKLEKRTIETISANPTVNTSIEYAGNYIYKNGVLQSFKHAEGYAAYNNGTLEYIYQYKDHLGNVRLSYKKNASNNLEVIEENNFYAFGLKQNGYNNIYLPTGNDEAQKLKYNGKELQEELKLNLYNYGARSYDPSIGRWLTIDPLASYFRSNTPYNYALNNPIYILDNDGYKPTPYEAAQMAAFAYGNVKKFSGVGGWKPINTAKISKSSGLKGTLFERTINGKTEYTFAFAGTDTNLKEICDDAVADVLGIIGLSRQYYEAAQIAKNISEGLGDAELTFAGHSLGGGLSNISSAVTGRSSIGFNSAWVARSTAALLHTVPLSKGNTRENYVHPNDPVTNVQVATSITQILDENATRHVIDANFSDFFDLPITNHGIDRMVQYLAPAANVNTQKFKFPEVYNQAYRTTDNIQRNIKVGDRGNRILPMTTTDKSKKGTAEESNQDDNESYD